MNRQDVNKLFDLLEQLYQGKKKPRDEVTVAIWAEVLKPWSYEQVRDAVIRRSRENRFTPDPSELTAYLPKPDIYRELAAGRNAAPGPAEQRNMAELKLWQQEWHRELREKGLPNLHEALAAGMSPGEWGKRLAAAGAFEDGGH